MGRLARIWRWFGDHDPISIVAAILIPHRALVGWATLVAFGLFVYLEATRANVVTTLWGVIGAGLVVSVILAEQGEGIQRRVWLRQNALTVGDFLNTAMVHVYFVGLVGAGVPQPTRHTLAFGTDRAERKKVAADALVAITRFGEAPAVPVANLPYESQLLGKQVEDLDRLMTDHASLLSRMTEVLGALDRWKRIARMTAHLLPITTTLATIEIIDPGGTARRTADDTANRELRRSLFVSLAQTSVHACEQCSDLLVEAGLLPRGTARALKVKKQKRGPSEKQS